MSHQTGMTASQELKDFFATAKQKDGTVRLIKVGVCFDTEEMVLLEHRDVCGTWDEDYDKTVLSVINEDEPCYIFYRLDSENEFGYEWLFIPFSPDASPTRQKMVFAGTRSTIKMEFGGGRIADELFGTLLTDVNLCGYHNHIASKDVDAPLTNAEEELNEVKLQHLEAAASGKANTLPGVSFPMDDSAITELIRVAKKEISYVQLSLDVEKEVINLERACDLDVCDLKGAMSTEKPGYHFFVFKHTHEGDYLESIVFIYSMPGYSCTIRERMLYSSCKAPLLSGVEQVLNMEIAKKMEIDVQDTIDEATLQDAVHPQRSAVREKFAKPKGPGGRGARRMIKKTTDEGEQNNGE